MTQLESQVIAILKENARNSNVDIAKQLNVDDDAVRDTISSLERRGAIRGYTAIIDDSVFDNAPAPVKALVELKIRPEKKTGYDAIAKHIYEYPNVVGHYLVSGSYDFLVIIEAKTHQEIAAFVFDKLATLDNITSTNTHFLFKKYKDLGHLMVKASAVERVAVSP